MFCPLSDRSCRLHRHAGSRRFRWPGHCAMWGGQSLPLPDPSAVPSSESPIVGPVGPSKTSSGAESWQSSTKSHKLKDLAFVTKHGCAWALRPGHPTTSRYILRQPGRHAKIWVAMFCPTSWSSLSTLTAFFTYLPTPHVFLNTTACPGTIQTTNFEIYSSLWALFVCCASGFAFLVFGLLSGG